MRKRWMCWGDMMNQSATIKLFLPTGDPTRIRVAEISNWSGKAVAAPRTEVHELLLREEAEASGVYILIGFDPTTNEPMAYVGEAEVLKDRLPAHNRLEFWIQVIIFVSKDDNLTKAHIRYLEGRLIEIARSVGRVKLYNGQASGSRLPESEKADAEVFLDKLQQLLPVLGTDISDTCNIICAATNEFCYAHAEERINRSTTYLPN